MEIFDPVNLFTMRNRLWNGQNMTDNTHINRISIFMYSFRDGGAEKVMIKIANNLSDRNYCVDIIVADNVGPYTDMINSTIKVSKIEGNNSLSLAYNLYDYLRETKSDILLSTMEMPNIISLIATRLIQSVPVVIQSVGMNSYRGRSGRYHLIPILKKITYPWADEIVSVSDGVARDLERVTGIRASEITTIYNPVDNCIISQKVSESVNHHWYDNKDAPIILAAGSLKPVKKFSTLIRSVAQMQEDARVIILGNGPKKEYLKNVSSNLNINDRVSFPGFVDNPYAWMAKADVFVLCSASEGFGNVLVEAMASGTPVVSTNCPGGPAEILDYGRYGPMVPVGDPEAMARAIQDVLSDSHSSTELQKRAADFDVESIVDQYEDLILSII
jgi:glycosyltransferase involved in cell wall biosynthesis